MAEPGAARIGQRGRDRRRVRITPLRIILAMALVLLAAGGSAWAITAHWAPPRDRYPVQGVALDVGNGQVDWQRLVQDGADFAYMSATMGTDRRDPMFAANWQRARAAGLRYGAIHGFSLCRLAADQAGHFMATVERDNAALPPVVALAFDEGCAARPARGLVLAELNTLINAMEAHGGKPVILRIAEDFEQQYGISAGINRTIWLDKAFFPPDYAAHPWVMWTANPWRRIEGTAGGVDWIVVKP